MNVKRVYPFLLILIIFLTNNALHGQVKGIVRNSQNAKPIANATVFINSTDISTQTNNLGEFSLEGLSEGFSELVIYKKGFALFKSPIMIAKNKAYTLDLQLIQENRTKDKNNSVSANNWIEIQSKLCGELENSKHCRILNPGKIMIEKNNSHWAITSTSPIEIENLTLGYIITIFNEKFDFVDVPDISAIALKFSSNVNFASKDFQEIEKNRLNKYLGSLSHFLLATSLGIQKGEGFTIFDDNMNEVNDSLSAESKIAGYKQIKLAGKYQVHFKKEGIFEKSIIETEDNLLVNGLGAPLNSKTIKIKKAMKPRGLSDLLPLNYVRQLSISNTRMKQILALEEKVYIHTDKSYYYPGDVLWFKAYLNFRSPELRDSLSKTLYVDLLNKQGNIVQSKTFRIDSGFSNGDFSIADSLKSQNYFLRAYTSLSRNFGDENIYIKQIPVLSIIEKVNSSARAFVVKDPFVSITSSKHTYKPREKIEIIITSQDSSNNNPLNSNLSISVVDMNQVVDVTTASIKERNPFLIPTAINLIRELNYPIEFGLTLKGRFLNNRQKPEKVRLDIFQLKPTDTRIADTNKNGEFTIYNLLFYDTSHFTFQVGKKEGYGKIELLQLPKPKFFLNIPEIKLSIERTNSRQRNFSEIEFDKDAKVLKEVSVEAKKEEKTENFRPYGKADFVIPSSTFNPGYPNILYNLQGRVAGLLVNPATGSVFFTRANRLSTLGTLDPLITLNDVPVDISILTQIDPNSVESIEVTKRINVLYGSQGANGVIAIYLKKGASESAISSKSIPSAKMMGYSKPRQFKAPIYTDPHLKPVTNDERATIYWNPNIKINSKSGGTATINFFAADHPTNYKIIVEGINEVNKPIHAEYILEIEN